MATSRQIKAYAAKNNVTRAIARNHLNAVVPNPCGDCRECCIRFDIDSEIYEGGQKPAGVACPKLCAEGCSIYNDPSKPPVCDTYKCVWLQLKENHSHLSIEGRPDRSGMIVNIDNDGKTIMIDETKPDSIEPDNLTDAQQSFVKDLQRLANKQKVAPVIRFRKHADST